MLEDDVFQKVKIDPDKLSSFGFRRADGKWVYETDFCGGDFHAVLSVDERLHLLGTVIEKETEEEYLPLRIKDAAGEFVHRVRQEYTALLTSVAMAIGTPVPFHSDQANRIALRIAEKYKDAPDFPWRKEGEDTSDYGVFRHPDNEKWYGLLMYTQESNLKTQKEKAAAKEQAKKEKQERARERRIREEAKKEGRKVPPLTRTKKKEQDPDKEKKINIINLKIRQEDGKTLWEEKGIYPAFHMSQKTWISVRLDDTLSDDRIMELIDNSYQLTAKGTNSHRRQDGSRVWIVPANPKYYDIVSVFNSTSDTVWKQGKGIKTGDTVYMYVAVPYSAILYKCTVTQAHSASENGMDLMDVHIRERYPQDLCTLEKMRRFHVTTVRGPRFMPEDLEKFIQSGGKV